MVRGTSHIDRTARACFGTFARLADSARNRRMREHRGFDPAAEFASSRDGLRVFESETKDTRHDN
jgi:hypothetical protein